MLLAGLGWLSSLGMSIRRFDGIGAWEMSCVANGYDAVEARQADIQGVMESAVFCFSQSRRQEEELDLVAVAARECR